jgi:hypothetical protein
MDAISVSNTLAQIFERLLLLKMIRKLCKLRRYLCIYFFAVLFLLFINREDSKQKHDNLTINKELGIKVDHKVFIKNSSNQIKAKKPRLSIDTYVSPEPCINCPGENGSAVIILVSK